MMPMGATKQRERRGKAAKNCLGKNMTAFRRLNEMELAASTPWCLFLLRTWIPFYPVSCPILPKEHIPDITYILGYSGEIKARLHYVKEVLTKFIRVPYCPETLTCKQLVSRK